MVQPPPLPPEPFGGNLTEAEDSSLSLDDAHLLPLPDGFVPTVMAGLPPRRKPTSVPALVRIAAAVLLAIGASLTLQGLSPTVARAEAPALLRHTFAPVVAGVPRPALISPSRSATWG